MIAVAIAVAVVEKHCGLGRLAAKDGTKIEIGISVGVWETRCKASW